MTDTALLHRRIAIGAAFGAANGALAVALVAVAAHVAARVMNRPPQATVDVTAHLAARVAEATSLSPSPALLFVLGVIVPAALGAFAGMLLHRCRLDPRNRVGESLAWTWRTLLDSWPATVLIAGAVAALHLYCQRLHHRPNVVGLLALLPFAFGIFSPRTASSDTATRWWLPQWPGWRCIAGAGAILAASFVLGIAVEFVGIFADDGFPRWTPLVEIVACAVDELFWFAIVMLLVQRWRLSDLQRHRAALARRDVLVPWLVGVLAAVALALPAMLLQLAARGYEVFVRPQVDYDVSAGRADAALAFWGHVATGLEALAALGLVIAWVAGWLMQARLAHVLPGATSPIELPAARVETPADHS